MMAGQRNDQPPAISRALRVTVWAFGTLAWAAFFVVVMA